MLTIMMSMNEILNELNYASLLFQGMRMDVV